MSATFVYCIVPTLLKCRECAVHLKMEYELNGIAELSYQEEIDKILCTSMHLMHLSASYALKLFVSSYVPSGSLPPLFDNI